MRRSFDSGLRPPLRTTAVVGNLCVGFKQLGKLEFNNPIPRFQGKEQGEALYFVYMLALFCGIAEKYPLK